MWGKAQALAHTCSVPCFLLLSKQDLLNDLSGKLPGASPTVSRSFCAAIEVLSSGVCRRPCVRLRMAPCHRRWPWFIEWSPSSSCMYVLYRGVRVSEYTSVSLAVPTASVSPLRFNATE